ncbi:MAG: deoxyribose-phosphate aldolase [Chloroflexi bacterium]|nr:deoxyribose-phosphate aldolase [Chloroflexota bacterium]
MRVIGSLLELAGQYEDRLPDLPPQPEAPAGAALAGLIDHTLLKPETTAAQVKQLCAEALKFKFATVCVNPAFVPLAAGLLRGGGVGVCAVVAFPLGASLPESKAAETRGVIQMGATEVDMALNIGALKGEAYGLALEDIRRVVEEAHAGAAQVKVIIEAALLTRREKVIACLLCREAGAAFVKTSTGFGPGGATVEDVALMRRVVGSGMGVKAAGGIRTLADALSMLRAGANRLGASAGVSILEEAGVK